MALQFHWNFLHADVKALVLIVRHHDEFAGLFVEVGPSPTVIEYNFNACNNLLDTIPRMFPAIQRSGYTFWPVNTVSVLGLPPAGDFGDGKPIQYDIHE